MPVFQRETKYLEFIINKKWMKLDKHKVNVTQSILEPDTVRKIRVCIEMSGFYKAIRSAFSRIVTQSSSWIIQTGAGCGQYKCKQPLHWGFSSSYSVCTPKAGLLI